MLILGVAVEGKFFKLCLLQVFWLNYIITKKKKEKNSKNSKNSSAGTPKTAQNMENSPFFHNLLMKRTYKLKH